VAAIVTIAVAEVARSARAPEFMMCAVCEELDDRIRRCHSLSAEAKDQLTIEGVKLLIEKYQSDKAALHQERE
jgi:hypothetical protein